MGLDDQLTEGQAEANLGHILFLEIDNIKLIKDTVPVFFGNAGAFIPNL
jgi:hypothetical protein